MTKESKQVPILTNIKLELAKPSKIKPIPYAGVELFAEFLFVNVYGEKKYGRKADYFRDESYFKSQIKKLISKLNTDIDNLQASELFISQAKRELTDLGLELLKGKLSKEKQMIIILSLRPIITFLGYGNGSNHKTREPYFIPTLWLERQGWLDSSIYYDRKFELENNLRIRIIEQLAKVGLSRSEIALVMNQTGYRIAQYMNEARVKKGRKK